MDARTEPPDDAGGILIGDFDHDEDMLTAVREGGRSLLRVRRWTGAPTAVLGRGSKASSELNLVRVRDDGLPVLRRRGGGCTVLLDAGNIVVSLVTRREGLGGSREFFAEVSALLGAALSAQGLPGVVAAGTSDLALGPLKISGSCIYRAKDLLYYSATLLVAPDAALIDRYLAHPPREPDYRAGRDHGAFLGRLDDLPGCPDPASLAKPLERELLRRLGRGWSIA